MYLDLGIHWLKDSEFLKGLRKIYILPASHFSLSGELTAKPPREWFQWKKLGLNKYLWFQIEILSVWNEITKRKVKMYELLKCIFFYLVEFWVFFTLH